MISRFFKRFMREKNLMSPFLKASAFILLFLCFDLHAQTTGLVYDQEERIPITGANIYLAKAKTGTTSDEDGFFRLKADIKFHAQDTLVISYLGYAEYRIPLVDYKSGSVIYLKPVQYRLDQSIDVFADRLEISTQEIPHQKTEITLDEITSKGSSEIGDIFKKTASVRLEGNDLQGRHIQIRGSNASEVNVYLDGILLNDLSTDHTADLSLIPVESLSKMEILKGANYPLIGQGAFGGVLNLYTRRSVKNEFMLKAKKGDFDSRQYSAYLNLPFSHSVVLNYFGNYNAMHPVIEYYPGEKYAAKSRNAQIESSRLNHSLNLDYLSPYGQLAGRFFNYELQYKKPGWTNRKRSNLFGLIIRGKNNLGISLNWIDSHDLIKRWVVESTKYLTDYQSKRMNVKLSQKIDLGVNDFFLVGDYYHYDLESLSSVKDLSGKRPYYSATLYDNRAGLGAIYTYEDHYKNNKNLNWKIFLGLRADFTAKGDRDLSNAWGTRINWKKNNWELSSYFSFGKNVKYPTLFERAYSRELFRISGQDTTLQPLIPEYNNSYEAGTNLRMDFANAALKSMEVGLSLFTSSTYNRILRRPMGDYIVQDQVGRNTTNGMEISININGLFRYFSVSSAYTDLDIGNPLLYDYKPEKRFNIRANYAGPFGFYLNTIFFYEGKSYAWFLNERNILETTRIDQNYDSDISAGLKQKLFGLTFNLQGGIYNLLDSNGYDYYYLRKRMYMVSFSVNY